MHGRVKRLHFYWHFLFFLRTWLLVLVCLIISNGDALDYLSFVLRCIENQKKERRMFSLQSSKRSFLPFNLSQQVECSLEQVSWTTVNKWRERKLRNGNEMKRKSDASASNTTLAIQDAPPCSCYPGIATCGCVIEIYRKRNSVNLEA